MNRTALSLRERVGIKRRRPALSRRESVASMTNSVKGASQNFHGVRTEAVTPAKGYGRTPSLRKKVIIGHQLVNADWNKLSPTKAVK
jgi:hypothetical protein